MSLTTQRSSLLVVLAALSLAAVVAERVDDAQTWPQQVAFTPPTKPTKFKHLGYSLLKAKWANLWGNDAYVRADTPIGVSSQYRFNILPEGLMVVPVKGESVTMYALDSGKGWTKVDQQDTSKDGTATVTFPTPAFEIPTGHTVPVRGLMNADNTHADFSVTHLQPGTSTVVFDIDGTLTTDNFQEIEEVILKFLHFNYEPKVNKGAVECVQAWYAKGYHVVYLTGRPGILNAITYKWLVKLGFPPGPLHLSPSFKASSGKAVQTYKYDFLAKELVAGGADIVAAYGNEPTDIGAYYGAGLKPDQTFIFGPHGGEQGTVRLEDYEKHLSFVQNQPAAAVPRPTVVVANV